MRPPIGLGSGSLFRRALLKEPPHTREKLQRIHEKLQDGAHAVQQAYYLLENTHANAALKARLYERICKLAINSNTDLARLSKERAIEQYILAGQQSRADYLQKLIAHARYPRPLFANQK